MVSASRLSPPGPAVGPFSFNRPRHARRRRCALSCSRVVSESGGDAADYGLAGKTKSISIRHKKEELRKIEIGRSSGINRFYARLTGKKPIYEAQGNLAELLNEPVSLWTEAPKSGAESPAAESVDTSPVPDSAVTLP